MSREPQSPMMRGWRSYEEPPAPTKTQPKPGKRKFKVRVEKKPAPQRMTREQALTKLTTTTEALTSEERGLLRELREVGPETAGKALSRIQEAKRQKGKR